MKHYLVGEDLNYQESRPAWGAWIETAERSFSDKFARSRPAWGAWIETLRNVLSRTDQQVAPRMGRVD